MITPETIRRAYLEVLREVNLYVRAKSIGAERLPDKQLFDLMDAIHNIPEFLSELSTCSPEVMRKLYLEPYDKCWAAHGLSLCQTLDRAVNRNVAQE